VKFYFNLPKGSTGAKIRFENGALVYPPDGTAQNDGKPARSWHDLPGDSPGLWSFELTAPGKVEGIGFQQVYGMGDAKLHFQPELTDSPRG